MTTDSRNLRGFDRASYLLGETARPFSIVFLVICIGVSLFLPAVGVDKITAVGVVFGALIAARSWENQVQIKANAEVSKTTTAITGQQTTQPAAVTTGAPQ